MSNKKICFVISPIGEEGSEIRKRADQVLKHVITPPATKCGYDPLRADKIAEPGMITTQVIQQILDAPLVIADLTGMNPNVFYELAIRHAIRKPLVQIIHKGDKIPFDVAGMRTIQVDHHDLDSVEEAKNEIEKQIKNVEGKGPEQIESPISATVDLQTLKKSERPEDRTLGEILSAITQLRSDVNHLQFFSPANHMKEFQAQQTEMRRRDNLRGRFLLLAGLRDELRHQLEKNVNLGATKSVEHSVLKDRISQVTEEIETLENALNRDQVLMKVCREV